MRKLVVLSIAATVLALVSGPVGARGLPQTGLPSSIERAAALLIDAAMSDDAGYDKLAWLTDRIGHRLSGSSGLERAVEWSAEQMRRDGLENVRLQPVQVPHWVRGQ